MEPVELASGLWRWTAPHPEWRPDAAAGGTADWPREVGCVLVETDDAAVFIDALATPAEPAFWSWADRRCARRRVFALTTIALHRRSRDELVERYGATSSRAKRNLPQGVRAMPVRGAGETIFWLPGHRALVAGDRLLGDEAGGLRICPESWLAYLPRRISSADLRELLRPLLELPIERVLVSHGEPVLADGRRALARALA
jgi:glyoxylase-like metal-dependent hydrolase (beta-lactamase superfamily II)